MSNGCADVCERVTDTLLGMGFEIPDLPDHADEVLAALDEVDFVKHQADTFVITRLSRIELTTCGLTEAECARVPDNILKRIAEKMANDYLEQLYWSSLEIIGKQELEGWRKEPQEEIR